MLIDHYPPLGLTLTTPRLVLRLPADRELSELADLAADGVHDPDLMPFVVTWTDLPPAERARSVIQQHWAMLGSATTAGPMLPFTVFLDGTVVGSQCLEGADFAVRREVNSWSWLGLRYHGQGIGTEMRAAVLHLAFAGLGAEEAASGAFEDNAASLAVSRKLGYQPNGTDRDIARGKLRITHRSRMTRANWEAHRTIPVTIDGLPAYRTHLGLD